MKPVRVLWLACCTMVLALRLPAQLQHLRWGPYAELGQPAGRLASTQARGLGAGLQLEFRLPVGMALDGSAGYLRFAAGSPDTASAAGPSALSAAVFRLGARLKLLTPLYLKLETGQVLYLNGASGSATLLAPGLGLQLLGLDLEAKYEVWEAPYRSGFLGLKLAYLF